MDDMHAHCLDEKPCLKQADRLKMDVESEDGTRRRVFNETVYTTHLGLNITNTRIGKRDNGAQSKFRFGLPTQLYLYQALLMTQFVLFTF